MWIINKFNEFLFYMLTAVPLVWFIMEAAGIWVGILALVPLMLYGLIAKGVGFRDGMDQGYTMGIEHATIMTNEILKKHEIDLVMTTEVRKIQKDVDKEV